MRSGHKQAGPVKPGSCHDHPPRAHTPSAFPIQPSLPAVQSGTCPCRHCFANPRSWNLDNVRATESTLGSSCLTGTAATYLPAYLAFLACHFRRVVAWPRPTCLSIYLTYRARQRIGSPGTGTLFGVPFPPAALPSESDRRRPSPAYLTLPSPRCASVARCTAEVRCAPHPRYLRQYSSSPCLV